MATFRFCPKCGTLASADARTCGRCGAKLPAPARAAPEAIPNPNRVILTWAVYIVAAIGGFLLLGVVFVLALTYLFR
ncbi:MAG: zinc ribbon domain-containing protein [Anaerolineae bacterium]|nr:zinc ribbon domain-containing protein [Anaerolineae bacterium]